jgi:signal transduction histidine kinase/ligand-binding sensor domain-containing protein
LFRFDGVQFERIELKGRDPAKSASIHSLWAEESGDLWAGFTNGGMSRIHAGHLVHYASPAGYNTASVVAFQRDAAGNLWAGCARGLLRFDGEHWAAVGPELGFTDRYVIDMRLDQNGTLWIAGEHLFRIRRGESRLERSGVAIKEYTTFLEDPGGRSWFADGNGVHLLPEQVGTSRRLPRANSLRDYNSFFDESGDLWSIGTDEQLRRYTPTPGTPEILFAKDSPAERFAPATLSADTTRKIMEDRAGNIWVATPAGIDRLRRNNVRTETIPRVGSGGGFALAAAEGGAVWVGHTTGTYSHSPMDGLQLYDGHTAVTEGPPIENVSALYRGRDGTLWIGSREGIWRRESTGRFNRLPSMPQPANGDTIHSITADDTGELWVSVVRSGLFRFQNGEWQFNGGLAALPQERPRAQALDSSGHEWFGYADNRVAVVSGEKVILYGPADGIQVGIVGAIHRGAHTVIAGEGGVVIEHEGRFHALTAQETPSALEGVNGIVETANGDLWLAGFDGAVHIPARELDEAVRTRTYTVAAEVFDSEEGFPGAAQRIRPVPTVIEGTDGRLWFAGTLGVGSIDPNHVRRNPDPPPVVIRSLVADHIAYSAETSAQLPQRTRDLQISYTALNLTRPERVRFRYRLDGYDKNWVDPGTRRQAFYTNLPPGDYRFRVIASNESGLWNKTGASVSIRIPPAFTQTSAFVSLCALTAFVLIGAAYLLRVRQLTSRERERLAERLYERGRIARELHDTLLQGVQGLLLRFQAIADQISDPQGARQAMNQALDRAEALLVESRLRVKDLRRAEEQDVPLGQWLRSAGEQMTNGQATRLRIIETGEPRDLHPVVQEEVANIATEAMFNAFRHAAAKEIEVELVYKRRELRISIRDDGCGMDTSVLTHGRDGHFGLRGMRERAARVKGELTVWSRPGAGTEVTLTVPAATAFAAKQK